MYKNVECSYLRVTNLPQSEGQSKSLSCIPERDLPWPIYAIRVLLWIISLRCAAADRKRKISSPLEISKDQALETCLSCMRRVFRILNKTQAMKRPWGISKLESS